jgi:hypothetical protein
VKPYLRFHVQPEFTRASAAYYACAHWGGPLWVVVLGYERDDFRFTGEEAENVLPGEY